MAQTVVMPRVRGMPSVMPSTAATAIPPKATWDRPSPMKEKRLSTSVTPSREEHSATKSPTTRA